MEQQRKGKILLVDDDPEVVTLVTRRIRAAGYAVATASDGVGCMQQARREEADLIILDLGMPAGDGYTSLERLRRNTVTAATPIIVLTGSDNAKARERALKAGATEFIEKQAGTEALVEAIDRCLSTDPS